MSETPHDVQRAMVAYQSGKEELEKIIFGEVFSSEQRARAREARDTLLDEIETANWEDFTTRTAGLRKLTTELNAVIASIQTNPIADVFDKLNGVVSEANTLLEGPHGSGGGIHC